MFVKISVSYMDIKKYGYFYNPDKQIAQDLVMDSNLFVLVRHFDVSVNPDDYTIGAYKITPSTMSVALYNVISSPAARGIFTTSIQYPGRIGVCEALSTLYVAHSITQAVNSIQIVHLAEPLQQ
jgi:hypothetical protein